MPRQRIYSTDTVEDAVRDIIPYLEDTSNTAHKAIYFDGWGGLAASAVLRAIAKHPPPSRLEKFDKIIHVDCSRWKSRRALQRTIAQELKLPPLVMDIFDRQDEEDDFKGVDEGSRDEIQDVVPKIHQALIQHISLLVFHNGSDNTIDFNDFVIPQQEQWFPFVGKVLWTFRGRLRLDPGISEKVDTSHLFLYDTPMGFKWNLLLKEEAREIAGYTDKLGEAVEECCLYLLSLNSQGGNLMDYDWATHASSYWVCDGIIQGGQGDEAWEVAAALHHNINIEDYSSNDLPSFGHELKTPPKRWILSKESSIVHPESTSFFLAAADASGSDPPLWSLPNDMFHQSENLHVLKLCRCTFSFSSPPFHCCHNLRFLGLDSCRDQQPKEDDKQDRPTMNFFKSLWVIDLRNTDWDLPSSPEIIEQMAANIREVHIKNGRFWHILFAWGQLQNLRKLRVIDPTCSWETGGKDEFTVLPSLSSSTSLKTLFLDGCVGLEHVEGLPPSLESFSLDARPRKDDSKEAKISRISLAGCVRLSDFTLRGSFPNLDELDLSGTRVKTLDLTTQAVQVPCLQRVMFLGCEQLRAVLWPENGMPQLSLLCIDTRGGEQVGRIPPDFDKLEKGHCQAYVAMMDMKFIQIVQTSYSMFRTVKQDRKFSLNLCVSACGQWCNKDKMGSDSTGKISRPTRPKSLIPIHSYNTYIDVAIDDITIDHDYNNTSQFQPSSCHVEIGMGISNTSVESSQGIEAIIFLMNKAESLHVHDNSSITTVIPEHMIKWNHLKQCHVVRCPKMHTVFTANYDFYIFKEIETFWAADLPMARCIWSKGRTYSDTDTKSFAKLRNIHLYSCPRLTFVLPLLWAIQGSYLHNLESLHIVNCGDLKTAFLVHPDLREGVLEFPSLKHIHLYELYKLQHICEVKMLAPKLERVWLRGCWGLRRLPAVGQYSRRPVVAVSRTGGRSWSGTGWRLATTLASSSDATRRITRSPCPEFQCFGEQTILSRFEAWWQDHCRGLVAASHCRGGSSQ